MCCRQASLDLSQSPLTDLRVASRIGVHLLVDYALPKDLFVERQKNVQEPVVDFRSPTENVSEIVRMHERHRDDDGLRIVSSDLSKRCYGQIPPKGQVLKISAWRRQEVSLHDEAQFLRIEDERLGQAGSQFLGKCCLACAERPVDPDNHGGVLPLTLPEELCAIEQNNY